MIDSCPRSGNPCNPPIPSKVVFIFRTCLNKGCSEIDTIISIAGFKGGTLRANGSVQSDCSYRSAVVATLWQVVDVMSFFKDVANFRLSIGYMLASLNKSGGFHICRAKSLLFIIYIFIFTLFSVNAEADEAYDANWKILFERCRASIEGGVDLDVSGLKNLGRSIRRYPAIYVPNSDEPIYPGYEVEEQVWEDRKSIYLIRETAYPSFRSIKRRACDIEVKGEYEELLKISESKIRREFRKLREHLVETSEYEISDPDPVFSTNLGFRSVNTNAKGCTLTFGLQMETRLKAPFLFTVYSAERAGCNS